MDSIAYLTNEGSQRRTMPEIGDTIMLAQLINRAVADDGFLHVAVVSGLVTAVYRNRDSPMQEYWQAVPGEDYLVLKGLLNNPDLKVE